MPGERREPFRVLDLFSGRSEVLSTVRERLGRLPKPPALHYIGIDSSPRVSPSSLRMAFPETIQLHEAELNLRNPGKLRATLKAALGDKRVDEIHMHMLPLDLAKPNSRGPETLGVLAEFLKKGGRLYHLFQQSPLFPQEIPFWRIRARPTEPPSVVAEGEEPLKLHEGNRKRIKEWMAAQGLRLDKYGMAPAGQIGYYFTKERGVDTAARHWVTSERDYRPLEELRKGGRNVAAQRIKSIEPGQDPRLWHIAKLADAYSNYGRSAFHFIIARKL